MPDHKTAGVPRRHMLRQAGWALAGASMASHSAGATEVDAAAPPWMTKQGTPAADAPYGSPSPFEKSVVRRSRDKSPFLTTTSVHTPLQDLTGIITPNGLHHVRSHAGTPAIDPDRHRLLVHGLVEQPLSFSMDDLARFPSVSRLHFLECSGNTPFYNAEKIKPEWTVQDTHGQVSCAEWTGVRLADVLAEAGVKAWRRVDAGGGGGRGRADPLDPDREGAR